MNDGTSEVTAISDREIVTTRVFDAPRELVFKAWTEPEHVAQWWGPDGFTNTIHEIDVRPGGVWRFIMHGPDGTDYKNEIIFHEVVKPERLVYTHGPGPRFKTTVTFDDQGGKTKLTMRAVFDTAEDYEAAVNKFKAVEGAKQHLARLGEHLSQMATERKGFASREIVLTRIFDAPRELVFKAWTEPKHLQRWWGPKTFTNPVCEADARVGGAWRIVMRAPDGAEYPCGGVYREIVAPERLVFTNIATDKDGNPIIDGLTTVTFEEQGGKTKLTLQTRGTALVAYAAEYLKGMEQGWSQSLERLGEMLAKT